MRICANNDKNYDSNGNNGKYGNDGNSIAHLRAQAFPMA